MFLYCLGRPKAYSPPQETLSIGIYVKLGYPKPGPRRCREVFHLKDVQENSFSPELWIRFEVLILVFRKQAGPELRFSRELAKTSGRKDHEWLAVFTLKTCWDGDLPCLWNNPLQEQRIICTWLKVRVCVFSTHPSSLLYSKAKQRKSPATNIKHCHIPSSGPNNGP